MRRAILLAEDNEDDVFFFRNAAKRAGWTDEILVAADGREAIDVLTKFVAGDPAVPRLMLVLLDLKMPFVSGLEVLAWAAKEPALHFLPIAVLSSSEQESDIESAYRLGAASFLVKPSQPEAIGDLLRAINTYWLQCNRLPASRVDRAPAATPIRT